ncbi:hypothetical protein C7974DRAFT_391113 [Boeremia exigua]|uniref:uncharacterized protein n=1 Tax=Boeremia exigua TaxID=749465 RepID=UPI001E8DE16E|nr:uncharacterized protein C7974DRAFT_391113 [Boeremia exigua]KAH6638228.1 hypothetical protein C7974DRAFT_391113 [Boeremia exigua]
MPFLDVCHLRFEPAVAIEDEASIFGKEWRMTLQYVLHQNGLKAAYRTHLSDEHDLWFLLLWDSEDSRYKFYHQTPGLGFMSQRMAKAPSVLFFCNDSYLELDESRNWTIDVLSAETKDTSELEHSKDAKQMSKLQEQQFVELLNRHRFVARHEQAVVENLYQGNCFGNAFFGLIRSDLCGEKDIKGGFSSERYSLELQKLEPGLHPTCAHTDVPTDIAHLTRKLPWEYAVLKFDTSEYSDTAYPMNLSFRPMSTLAMADKFLSESDGLSTTCAEVGNAHAVCIVSKLVDSGYPTGIDKDANDSRAEMGLHDGVKGLQELSILQMTGNQAKNKTVRFLCSWDTTVDFEQWRQNIAVRDHCSVDLTWTSGEVGMPKLKLEDMPLTPDNQSWQDVDKILEIVEFTFMQNLSPVEKEAFEHRVYALTNTMSSCWSGDIDGRPVVYAEDPVWTQSEEALPSCLLLLSWDGTAQRTAWLRSFMANGFIWTGHIAFALGTLCNRVESGTYNMDKVYSSDTKRDVPSGVEDGGDTGYDSDRDMGF